MSLVERQRSDRNKHIGGSKQTTPPPPNKVSHSTTTKLKWKAVSRTKKEEEEEEERPVIYLRAMGKHGYEWFSLEHSDDMSSKVPICKCGAVKDLKSPVFYGPHKSRPYSSIAAVGPFIYAFGGLDLDDKDLNASNVVSYIDTRHPLEGWKVCKKQMPKGRYCSYPITLDDGRVLLVGGFCIRVADKPFAQMYHSSDDHWVPLNSSPIEASDSTVGPFRDLFGHGLVKEEGSGDTMILMHGYMSPFLYTYNVTTDSWGTRWDGGFRTQCSSGALLNGIYYVVDVSTNVRVVLCGYDIHSEQAKCLPVEIRVEEEDDDRIWVPLPDIENRLPQTTLMSCGDTKLAMIWYTWCYHDRNVRPLSFYWSIFEMTKEPTDDMPRLVAHPLSHVCYHVNSNVDCDNNLLPIYSSRYLPESSIRVSLSNKKGGEKHNKVAPIDLKKDKMRSAGRLKNFKESPSESVVPMNNKYECLACGDDEEDVPTERGK